tara:strand:- start:994 stop:1218 length:225 start_codon:yes stop_codon:yes gene_type:complete
MMIITMAAASAAGYYIILRKALGSKMLRKSIILWDILLTMFLPLLFLGTYSGVMTAILAGLIFSIFTHFLHKMS